jgi:hypothetical protein
MSHLVLDEHLSREEVLEPLRPWRSVQKIEDLAPHETLKDDRILQILRRQKQPTLITLDGGFFLRRYCDPRYCLLYFVIPRQQQARLPGLLRQMFRLPAFKTKAARMGKVVRISSERIEFWQIGEEKKQTLPWR